MGYVPTNTDTSTSGTITALNQTVALATQPGHSSWTVQTSGTFVATLTAEFTIDGTNWIAANLRQTGVASTKNTVTTPGIFRGNCGGIAQVRVRCSAYTSGTIIVTIRCGGVGAIFQNATVVIQDQFQYFASAAGGNVGYNATVGPQTIVATGANIALFRNPTGSPTDAYIESFTLGSDIAGRIERWRQPTITSATTPITNVNRGGAASTGNARMYVPAQFVSSANGTLAKVSYLAPSATEQSTENGSIILRPGQDILFRFDPVTAATANCSIEVVWWEAGTLT